MKKYLVLVMLILTLAITACTRDVEDGTETPSPVETPTESESSDGESESETEIMDYIEYTYPELIGTPTYDKESGILKLFFTDYIMWKNTDANCTVGVMSDDGMTPITAHAAYDEFPEMIIASDIYSGVPLKLEEPIGAGSYKLLVVFGNYRVDFDITVE